MVSGQIAEKLYWLDLKSHGARLARTDLAGYRSLTPIEALRTLSNSLSLASKAALSFAFSERAFLKVLAKDFSWTPVASGGKTLSFAHERLDLDVLSRAYGDLPEDWPDSQPEQFKQAIRQLESASIGVFQQQRTHYQKLHSRQEFELLLWAYLTGSADQAKATLAKLARGDAATIKRFGYHLYLDALNKADASEALFGKESLYSKGWRQKQYLRYCLMEAFAKTG